jgi:hypothetical protein
LAKVRWEAGECGFLGLLRPISDLVNVNSVKNVVAVRFEFGEVMPSLCRLIFARLSTERFAKARK